jgi:hypothetical protein
MISSPIDERDDDDGCDAISTHDSIDEKVKKNLVIGCEMMAQKQVRRRKN